MTVLVIGGSGRTGRLIVQRLRQDDHDVRVLARSPSPDPVAGVETVSGTITDPAAVADATQAVTGVIVVVESAYTNGEDNAPEQVHHRGIRNVLDALAGRPQVPVVLVSQIYINRPEAFPEAREIIAARGRAEQALRAGAQPYTIVRPSWLTDAPGGQVSLRIEQGDTGDGQVPRQDVAETVVRALQHPQAQGKTFELYAGDAGPAPDWAATFSALAPDRDSIGTVATPA